MKSLLDREMKTKTIALSLGLILAAGALYAADSFEGTWKLNESKSKLTRGTGKNTKVVYDSRLIRDKMTVTGDGVDADGKPVHMRVERKIQRQRLRSNRRSHCGYAFLHEGK